MNELSLDVITHKLVVAGIGTKYIDKKFAETIFNQLNNKDLKVITISNPETFTYFQKYKNDVSLLPLDGEDKSLEDLLFMSGISENKKEEVRQIVDNRKTEKKKVNENIIKDIIEGLKS